MNRNQNQTANQQTALVSNKQSLRTLLAEDRVTQTLQRVGTRWMSADQIKTQAMIAVARNPKLLNCSRFSFLESVVRAAELGLRFAGAGGEAYLIPYGNKSTLIIGYRGLLALARRTGKVTRIEARCVCEKDFFKIEYGGSQQLIHRPSLGPDRGNITCVYALAELRGGGVQIEVMTRLQIDQIRARSRASKEGPWVTDFEEMARKTVLRRLCKYLPFPTAFEDALASENPAAMSEDQPRRQVETKNVIPDSVDIQTGEIVDAGQVDTTIDEGQNEIKEPGFEHFKPSDPSDLDNQKSKLIDKICTQLGQLYPGDNIESQAARLKTLNYIFGKTVLDEIVKLPIQILEAGLGAMKSKAAATETEDIPV